MPTTVTDMLPMLTLDTVPTDTDMLPMPTLDTVPTDTDTPGMVDTDISARGPLMPSPRPMPTTAMEATDTEATDIGTVDTGPDTSMVKRNFIDNAMCARVLD